MQLVALVGGEIEYYGYTIGIRKHVGSETPIDIMKSNLVQDISYSYNVSENTTSYNLSLYQKSGLALGDELKLSFAPLGIDSFSRIVGWEWNPFNYKEVQITVGQYLPTINDSLFSVIDEVQDITETRPSTSSRSDTEMTSSVSFVVSLNSMVHSPSSFWTMLQALTPR